MSGGNKIVQKRRWHHRARSASRKNGKEWLSFREAERVEKVSSFRLLVLVGNQQQDAADQAAEDKRAHAEQHGVRLRAFVDTPTVHLSLIHI